MSISSSLSTALSGLTAASRAAEVVSNNISNALTEGYGKREIQLSSRVLGGAGSGVRVDGVSRLVDPAVIGSRRLSQAALAEAGVAGSFLADIEAAIGTPDDPGSLTGRIAGFEARLIEATSRPDSNARLEATVLAAGDVALHLNELSDRLQQERMTADRTIAGAVDRINATLGQIADLNAEIVRFDGAGQDATALLDQRQRLIDGIADLVPLREVPRDNGTVALFTPGGAILLDGKAAELGFVPAGLITPDMTLGSGALSGLTLNGNPLNVGAANGPIAGGRLAGLFALRDVQAPAQQTRLDALARDLMERFEAPGPDPTLVAGDPGLFTDAGAAFSSVDELGLAGRIAVNALVDPAAGGEAWRLRDGLGAGAPGDPGDATLLSALSDALSALQVPASGGFGAVPRSASGLAADVLSAVSVAASHAEDRRAFLNARTDTLIGVELQGGVDTDEEMQRLLLIERAFAANARVVSTIDEMIQTLLGL